MAPTPTPASTPAEPRRRRALLVMAVSVALVGAMIGPVSPSAAQIDAETVEDAERGVDELQAEVDDLTGRLAELDTAIADLDERRTSESARVELVADDLERTVDARQAPASTYTRIALAGFIGGDPRSSALVEELQAVQGSDVPSQRREMYGAVMDGALDEMAELDDRLRTLGDDMDEARAAVADIDAELDTTRSEAREVRATLDTRRTELEAARTELERLRVLEAANVLTGLTSFDDPTRPAVVVKIDNVPAAMPQAGINQADVVYVEEVEGGLTRLAAVFHSTGAEVVGPIRSMRTGDIDLLTNLNSPLFAHSGGNRGSRERLAGSSLVDVGADAAASAYYRDTERPRPHNLMGNVFNFWALGSGRGNTPNALFTFREPQDSPGAGAQPLAGITVRYRSVDVDYDWNGSGWVRRQDGEPTVDTEGVAVAPTTVIVQLTEYGVSGADAASPEARTVGSGRALVLTDGQVAQATWQRPSAGEPTRYLDANGDPVSILRGRTWIELARPGNTALR